MLVVTVYELRLPLQAETADFTRRHSYTATEVRWLSEFIPTLCMLSTMVEKWYRSRCTTRACVRHAQTLFPVCQCYVLAIPVASREGRTGGSRHALCRKCQIATLASHFVP